MDNAKMLMVWDGVRAILKTCYLGSVQGERELGKTEGSHEKHDAGDVTLYSGLACGNFGDGLVVQLYRRGRPGTVAVPVSLFVGEQYR